MFEKVRSFFMIILSLSLIAPLYSFSGGDGSSSNPYQVGSCVDLDNISNYLTDNFIQISDIDCNVAAYNSGSGFDPIGGIFTGVYNGSGYVISNLFINRPSTDNVGLFGRTGSGAILKNISLENINITGKNTVGGLVGHNNDGGNVFNSYATGYVAGDMAIGGLVGISFSSNISNSFATGDVVGGIGEVGGLVGQSVYGDILNSYASSTVSGNDEVGGLVGDNAFGEIINSYSYSNVSANDRVGGVAGYIYNGKISNSYSYSNISGNLGVGGIVGYTNGGGNVSNSYSLGAVSGSSNVGGLVGNNFGIISNSLWLNNSNNPSTGIGSDSNSQTVLAESDITYFYDDLNSPMDVWNLSVWDFSGTGLPTLLWNSNGNSGSIIPSVVNNSSPSPLTNLPSFGFWSSVVVAGCVIGFLI